MVVLQPPSVSFVERSRLGIRQRSPCGRLYGARAGRILLFQPRSLRAPEQSSTLLPAPFLGSPAALRPCAGWRARGNRPAGPGALRHLPFVLLRTIFAFGRISDSARLQSAGFVAGLPLTTTGSVFLFSRMFGPLHSGFPPQDTREADGVLPGKHRDARWERFPARINRFRFFVSCFPGFSRRSLLRKDTSGGRCGGLSSDSSHPVGSVVSEKKKKN